MKYLSILGLVVAALLCVGMDTNYELATKHHVVREGQTIWGIATRYMPEQDRTRDVRELVYEIGRANNLKGYKIHPGDVLIIPLQVEVKK